MQRFWNGPFICVEMGHSVFWLSWYQMKIHKNGPFEKYEWANWKSVIYLCPSRFGKFEVSKRPWWTDLVYPSGRSTLPTCKVNFAVQARQWGGLIFTSFYFIMAHIKRLTSGIFWLFLILANEKLYKTAYLKEFWKSWKMVPKLSMECIVGIQKIEF